MAADPTALTETFNYTSNTHAYKIHWTSLGNPNGPPLVFVHGTPWSSRVWVPYALAFASQYLVYLFDNPGYGQSLGGSPNNRAADEPTDLDASLAGQALAFSALLQSWDLKHPPHIIAHDNGGLISLRAVLLHGSEYSSLCLIDVVAVRPWGSPFFRLAAVNPDLFSSIPESIFEGIVYAYIREAAYKPLSVQILDMLAEPWISGGTQGQKAFIRQMIQADQRHAEEVDGRYGEVGKKMPVKIIWGKEDVWIPVDRAQRLGKMIGTDKVVIVEEAGHLIHYDQPERLGVELGTWITLVGQGLE